MPSARVAAKGCREAGNDFVVDDPAHLLTVGYSRRAISRLSGAETATADSGVHLVNYERFLTIGPAKSVTVWTL
jgi:hypothetical protein